MRKIVLSLSVLVCVVLLLGSCTRKYRTSEAKALAATHRLIAVIPPYVATFGNIQTDRTDSKERQSRESLNFQQRMYTWMLRGRALHHVFVNVQKVQETNARLAEAGYFDEHALSPAELCAILNVDAVLIPNYLFNTTMTDFEVKTQVIGTGDLPSLKQGKGPINNRAVILELFDQQTGRVIWDYVHKLSRDTRSTPSWAVDEIVLTAGKKIPYYQARFNPPL
ncbi:hypothetical protein [Telluribacter sp.]|jgi:hypothetical protein|uniref:hypothetical protein n=1 Tax=Telluribacter sp. TaxID=1978767 RepID=UPI002E0D8B7E|nr:hypothetical protein [Telluribacter sp.]